MSAARLRMAVLTRQVPSQPCPSASMNFGPCLAFRGGCAPIHARALSSCFDFRHSAVTSSSSLLSRVNARHPSRCHWQCCQCLWGAVSGAAGCGTAAGRGLLLQNELCIAGAADWGWVDAAPARSRKLRVGKTDDCDATLEHAESWCWHHEMTGRFAYAVTRRLNAVQALILILDAS